jgi:phosphomannomutase/phosphoglucomutase
LQYSWATATDIFVPNSLASSTKLSISSTFSAIMVVLMVTGTFSLAAFMPATAFLKLPATPLMASCVFSSPSCEYDGNFPGRDPNPAVYAHLTELQKKVVASRADFGAAFDGDGDRVVFVDDLGRVVMSEQSFVILIREYLKIKPGGVVYDLKSSSIVRNEVKKLGGTPLMERSGHAFIKRTMIQKKAALAGEISGHFFFGELGYDDGMYAALKMAEILYKSGQKLSEMVDAIPKTMITPDIRIPVPYDRQEGILKGLRALGKKYSLSEMDGVRVEFPFGWLLVRKSVTEQAMTVRIEAEDGQGMAEIKGLLKEYAPDLAGCLE